jgi:regulator of protease activity HflC (stomatin/prohibitin superfamily)
MERNIQKNGLINFFILLVSGVAGLIVSRYASSLAGEVTCVFLGLGVLIAGVSWFQMRLEEQERLEKLEMEELTRNAESSRLFNTDEAEVLPARRSRQLFEKYFVRAFTVLLLIMQAGGAWWVWRGLQGLEPEPLNQPLMAMALLGMFALILFLIGKYSSGLARLENQRLLRPGASYLLLGAYLLALTVAGIVAVQAGLPLVDLILAQSMCAVLGLLAVETFFSLILEVYRPRIKGQVGLLLYDGRLVGLLSHPEGLFTTAAHALDYQFGFKVSETWFYQFLQRAFSWMVLVQLALLLLSTCFVFIEAGQEALLERFGEPVSGRDLLEPGLHFKFPWPIDQVRRFQTEQIQHFNIGFEHGEAEAAEKSILWTVAHYKKEFHLLVASRSQIAVTNGPAGKKNPPVNLLSLGLPVQYRIKNLRAWAYNHENSGALLEDVATREVVRYLVSADMNELMSTARFPASRELRDRIQARADDLKLGVEIVFLGLQDIHPPVKVASSYEKVVAARQNKEAEILSARAFQIRTNGLARSEVLRIEREAEAERKRLEVDAHARAALFTNQIPAYRASPSVYVQRAYLEALSEGSQDARKVVLATTNTQDVILLDLEEKIRPDLLDVPLPSPKSGSNP